MAASTRKPTTKKKTAKKTAKKTVKKTVKAACKTVAKKTVATVKKAATKKTAKKSKPVIDQTTFIEYVRTRAYYIWESEGGAHGMDEDCWARAQADILNEYAVR